MTTFNDFGLHARLLKTLADKGFTTPTPVQAAAIGPVLEGKDVMACAQTGTGKTAAFVLPALHKIISGPSQVKNHGGPRVLVLTPTRELAQQVTDNIKLFSRDVSIRSGVIVGGVSYTPQFRMLDGSLDMLVATPGRLIDHLNEDRVDFSRIEMVVLDEADRMVDMGFLKPVERILEAIRKVTGNPQILLFSATFTPSVDKVARKELNSALRLELATSQTDHSQITQKAIRADGQEHKFTLLKEILGDKDVWGSGQTIVFAATKHGADKLADKLSRNGLPSAALHGGMKQNARKRTLTQLHKGEIRVLVATDVAARGIDVKSLSTVVNFDLPQVSEDYVHRIGRTGRGGETGVAVSFVAPSDYPMLRDIEKLLGKKIALESLTGFEPQLDQGEFERQGRAAPRSRKGMNKGFGSREGGFGGGFRKDFGGNREERSGKPQGRSGGFGGGNGGGFRKRFDNEGESKSERFGAARSERRFASEERSENRGPRKEYAPRPESRFSRDGQRPAYAPRSEGQGERPRSFNGPRNGGGPRSERPNRSARPQRYQD